MNERSPKSLAPRQRSVYSLCRPDSLPGAAAQADPTWRFGRMTLRSALRSALR